MPPNLGGFFMVRSYYPSECHADYFDFERIEALKPAIDRKSGSAEMPRPISYAVFCLKKKTWPARLAPPPADLLPPAPVVTPVVNPVALAGVPPQDEVDRD